MARLAARHLLAIVLLGAALLLAGCGRPAAEPSQEEALAAGLPRRTWNGEPFCPRALVALPEARHARWERPEEAKFCVNLLRSGDVRAGGWEWPLRHATAAERQDVLDGLRRAYVERADAGTHDTMLPVLLHADHVAAWSDARDVLACLLDEAVGVRRVLLAVSSRATDRDVVLEGLVEYGAAGEATAASDGLAIELTARVRQDEQVEVRLASGDRAWTATIDRPPLTYGTTYVPGLPTDDEDAKSVPEPFAKARSFLASAAAAHEGASLRLPDAGRDVRWGDVATVLDLLVGAGLREVALPSVGVRLVLMDAQPLVADPFVHADDPVLSPSMLALAALAFALAFLVTLAPLAGLRDGRRRRRRA